MEERNKYTDADKTKRKRNREMERDVREDRSGVQIRKQNNGTRENREEGRR